MSNLRFKVKFHYRDKNDKTEIVEYSEYFKTFKQAKKFAQENSNVCRPSVDWLLFAYVIVPVKRCVNYIEIGVQEAFAVGGVK